jgi:nucleotide-binding universal stress UspA family protein
MRVLVCCKDPGKLDDLLQVVRRLNLPDDTRVTLLTVIERGQAEPVIPVTARAQLHWPLEHKTRRGSVVEEILAEAVEGDARLVVSGWRTQRTTLGSTMQRLFRSCPVDLLLVRPAARQLTRALVCTGGEAPSLVTLRSAAEWLNREDLEVGVLHVMSQVAVSDSSPHQDLIDTAETAMARDTREGSHLQQALAVFREAGYRGRLIPLLRHGLVVDEVLAELRHGGHELLVIGSRNPRGRRRWSDLLLEDVGAKLASGAHCSVLLIRPSFA